VPAVPGDLAAGESAANRASVRGFVTADVLISTAIPNLQNVRLGGVEIGPAGRVPNGNH
jgi:hypothetical protein